MNKEEEEEEENEKQNGDEKKKINGARQHKIGQYLSVKFVQLEIGREPASWVPISIQKLFTSCCCLLCLFYFPPFRAPHRHITILHARDRKYLLGFSDM